MKGEDEKGKKVVSWRNRGVIGGFLCALVAFVVYLGTLAPTVVDYEYPATRDAISFQVKAAILGINDVTGYPTYTMLGHLFTYLPVGDPAYRVNLLSAVAGAVAVGLLFLVCSRITHNTVASAAGALLFALSETFWSQAVIAEVYALNALFISLVLLVLFVWRDARKDRYLLLAAFVMGLSLTHHVTSGLLLPAGVLFVLIVDWRKLLEWRLLLKGAGLFLAGLLPYLYLPIRASMEFSQRAFSLDPGLTVNHPSTLKGFVDLVTGAEFRILMFAFAPAELPARFEQYLGYLYEQFHPAFLAVALLGVVYLLFEDRSALFLLGFLYVGWLLYALEYDIRDYFYYFIPTYLVLAVLVAAGFAALLRGAEVLAGRAGPVQMAVVAVVSAVVLLSPFLGVWDTYAVVDRSEHYRGREMIEVVAAETKPGATVIHHRSPLWYMIFVEGRREDLKLASPFMRTRDFRGIATAKSALKSGPTYIIAPGIANSRFMREAGLDLIPIRRHVLYEIVPRADRGYAKPV